MAAIQTGVKNDLAPKLIVDESLGATSQDDVTSAAGSVYMVQIDATAGSPTTSEPACYVKMVDASSATVGSTSADIILYAPIGKITSYVINGGWAFSSGLSIWAVTSAAVSGNVSPTSSVKVTIFSS